MYIKFQKDKFDVVSFIEELGSLASKISGTKFDGATLIVYLENKLTAQQEADLAAKVSAHAGNKASALKIYSFIPKDSNYLTEDFTIVGLRKKSPKYVRGRKTNAEYLDPETDEVVAEKTFIDVRNESGDLITLDIKFDWYNEDGVIGGTKTETAKEYNEWEPETTERQRRERQLDFLVREGKRAGQSDAISLLFDFFKTHIDKYVASGDASWEHAVRVHAPISSDPAVTENIIYGILEARPEGVLSIREAILYQVCGELPS